MGLEAGIWASRPGFGPGFEPRDWDLRGGDEEGGEGEGGENPLYMLKHRSSIPMGPLPKKVKKKDKNDLMSENERII